jgi:hypothetical protein
VIGVPVDHGAYGAGDGTWASERLMKVLEHPVLLLHHVKRPSDGRKSSISKFVYNEGMAFRSENFTFSPS